MSKLEDKTAIVTGAASGIGRATALAMARAGARVAAADINRDGALSVADEICEAGGRAEPIYVDLADPASIEAMVTTALERFGRLDILFNNAANTAPDIIGRDLDLVDMDLEVWEQTMAVNLRAVMLASKFALPHMLEAGRGVIINTSSVSGLLGDLAMPAYGVSKGGVNTLTQYIATQYGKRGIRCNAIAPGVINTPALERKTTAEQRELYAAHHLTPGLGEPEDIAQAVVFLAGDQSAFITGQIIRVDGGLLSHHPAVAHFRTPG